VPSHLFHVIPMHPFLMTCRTMAYFAAKFVNDGC
jgi:hypothetical protein